MPHPPKKRIIFLYTLEAESLDRSKVGEYPFLFSQSPNDLPRDRFYQDIQSQEIEASVQIPQSLMYRKLQSAPSKMDAFGTSTKCFV